MPNTSKRTFLTLVFLVTCTAAPALAQVSSPFDTGSEGWLTLSHNTASWQSASGNPGGCLLLEDRVMGISHHTWASAPAKFLGDWSAFGAGDSLAFDVFFGNTSGGVPDDAAYRVYIYGPGGSAKSLTGPESIPPESLWTAFAVSFDPGDWVVISGSWGGLLAEVTSLRFNGEYVVGVETVKLDNVRLTSSPVPVHNPCASEAFNVAGSISDFTVVDVAEPSNYSTEGNGGGFLQVSDLLGANSYALAPSRFLGDWRPFEGTGRVTVDIRVVSPGSVNYGSPDFIRISGPGGAAYVTLDAADVPHGLRLWKTFTFPIDSLVWTMESGTWSGLLTYVEECRIDVEYYDGTETIGLDNFGRISDLCGYIDNPVAIEQLDFWFETFYSLITPGSVVYNPADSMLYAVVPQTSATGGLYYVFGPDAGARRQAYDQPTAAVADTDGDMYVSHGVSGYVYRLAFGGSSSLWVSGFHSGDDDPAGMAFAPPGFNGTNVSEGDIIVVDVGNSGPDEIWTFSPDVAEGELQLVPDLGDYDFADVTSTPGGTVYVCDRIAPDSLYSLGSDGSLTGIAIDPPLSDIISIVYDPVGAVVYAADADLMEIHRIDPSTGATDKVFSGFTTLTYACLEIDLPTRRLWVADYGYHRVYELEISPITAARGGTTPRQAAPRLRVVPNPFNPATAVHFVLNGPAEVRLDIYDVAGRHVRRLFEGRRGAGHQTIEWNGRGEGGRVVASGVYFARLSTGGQMSTARLVLLK